MNFSVHFDDDTLARLQAAVGRMGLTRNRAITVAVQEWLARNQEKDWPPALKSHFFNPAPDLAEDLLDFEAWRAAMPDAAGPRW